VQNDVVDRVPRRHLPELAGDIDGIEEFWFDGPEEGEPSPAAVAARQDEARFLRGKTVFAVHEIVGYEPAEAGRRDKRISLLLRWDGMSKVEFSAHWSTTHLALARAHRHADRYVQNHVLAATLRQDLPEPLAAIDGFGIFETADLAAMQRSYATAPGRALNEDAARFIAAVSTFRVASREVLLAAASRSG
jgi:hypothetical protein